MKKLKTTILLVTIFSLVAAIAHATVGTRTATLSYDNIKITLDGKETVPIDANGNAIEAFIIDGTTYLPVRGISSALGLDVGWDNNTKTVTLNTPGAFPGAVQVYDDNNVTIEFAGCTAKKPYSWIDTIEYHANFNVKNKTDAELTFQADALSFNGISYDGLGGSDSVAPQSSGKISFYSSEPLPTSGINKTSGQIRVIDFAESILDMSYDAKWVNVSQ